MADYSHCQLRIKLADANRLATANEDSRGKFFDRFDLGYSTSDISGDIGNLYETFDFDQARYGLEELSELLAYFQDHGIGFLAIDHGGFDWMPYEYAWKVGMDEPRTRYIDEAGEPLLTKYQWELATKATHSDYECVMAVADHFGDDPRKWLGGQRG